MGSKEAAYEAFKNCDDVAVKHMAFWLVSLQRTWGAFQTAFGIGLWCIIFLLPVRHRAAVHFIISYLQITVGFIAKSIMSGAPLPDLVTKFGGSPPGAVTPEEKPQDGAFVRPNGSAINADFISPLVLGVLNL